MWTVTVTFLSCLGNSQQLTYCREWNSVKIHSGVLYSLLYFDIFVDILFSRELLPIPTFSRFPFNFCQERLEQVGQVIQVPITITEYLIWIVFTSSLFQIKKDMIRILFIMFPLIFSPFILDLSRAWRVMVFYFGTGRVGTVSDENLNAKKNT